MAPRPTSVPPLRPGEQPEGGLSDRSLAALLDYQAIEAAKMREHAPRFTALIVNPHAIAPTPPTFLIRNEGDRPLLVVLFLGVTHVVGTPTCDEVAVLWNNPDLAGIGVAYVPVNVKTYLLLQRGEGLWTSTLAGGALITASVLRAAAIDPWRP